MNKIREHLNIFKFWQGNNRDRFLLFGIIAAVWLLVKAIEEFLPQRYLDVLPSNVSLTIFAALVALIFLHASFIYIAQRHRRSNPYDWLVKIISLQ